MGPSITDALRAAAGGDRQAMDAAYAPIYAELKRIAKANRRRWRGNETLNTTALVHEAFLRLCGDESWDNRVHFYATAAKAMRQILISYAESRNTAKRGGGLLATTLDELAEADPRTIDELLDLDKALTALETHDERQCRVVECRFFVGLSIEQTAVALGVSVATIKRDWLLASARLHEHLAPFERSA